MKIAVVNALTDAAQDNRGDVERAREYVQRAAASHAELVVLPETFPGRWRKPIRDAPTDELAELAKSYGVHLVGGFAEPCDDETGACFNSLGLFGPDGREVGRYRRTTPGHAPWIYDGGKLWDFDWVPSCHLPVFDVGNCRVGMLVCSEVFVPELARILAVRGAEIIVMPAGVIRPESELFESWRVLARARAIENLATVALCSNLTPQTHGALAYAADPEHVLLEEYSEGVHLFETDLERLRWLRGEQDRLFDGSKPWRAKPGVFRDWRRSEVLGAHREELAPQ